MPHKLKLGQDLFCMIISSKPNKSRNQNTASFPFLSFCNTIVEKVIYQYLQNMCQLFFLLTLTFFPEQRNCVDFESNY